jgi:hypothetical protein
MAFKSPLAHPTVLFRKNSLLEHNLFYDENYSKAEDYELWSRAIFSCQFANIQEILLDYRLHHAQVRESHANLQAEQTQEIRRLYLQKSGLNASSDELELHYQISNSLSFPPAAGKQWIRKIRQTTGLNESALNSFFNLKLQAVYLKNPQCFIDEVLNQINCTKKAPVIIYGYGSLGKVIYSGLRQCVTIDAIIDQQLEAQGIFKNTLQELNKDNGCIFINTVLSLDTAALIDKKIKALFPGSLIINWQMENIST